MTYFIQTHKQKQLLMKLLLMMFLNQSILQLYQTYKNLQEKVQAGLWIQLQTINISKYNPLAGSSYIKLLKELDHPRRGLINIRNFDDNECFKWSLIRYVNPADRNPARIAKADKFPVKIRDIKKKTTEKRIPLALLFLIVKIRKNIQSLYQKNGVKKKMVIYDQQK